ncbi:type II secretion system protein [Deinococcus detaillensis]|uniref:Type II secretion system protein n=1 Tax=Deinococcus detaillensis TaxID=2592048 RepID=A0A553UQH2_9DEIO|nr:type II secretion system protein [Deinococcus detaillensis]TSA82458.1 type II secretion system protein [Deinococcus detaillensis]
MNNKNRTQGFTLIELLIVIAIIGILAAVLIPNLLGAQKRAYDTGAASCAKSLQTVQAINQVDNQQYLATIAKTVSGVNAACQPTQVTIAGGASGTGNLDYSMTVTDSRGSKTYTITPSSLSGVNNP